MTAAYAAEDHHWQDFANCLGTDPSAFDEATRGEGYGAGNHMERVPRIADAITVCRFCTVRVECKLAGSSHTDYPNIGVYGGEYVSRTEAVKRLAKAKAEAGEFGPMRRINNRWNG